MLCIYTNFKLLKELASLSGDSKDNDVPKQNHQEDCDTYDHFLSAELRGTLCKLKADINLGSSVPLVISWVHISL